MHLSRSTATQSILSSTLLVITLALVVKVVGFAREVVVAQQFGRGDVVDAFAIALLFPSFFANVIAGSFSSAMVPSYVQMLDKGGSVGAQQFLTSVSAILTVLALVAAVTLTVLVPGITEILSDGFSGSKRQLTERLAYALIPIVAFCIASTLWTAVLNATNRFAAGTVVPVVVPLSAIAVLITLGESWGIYALAAGTLLGFLLQAVWLGVLLRRYGIGLWPRWHGNTPEVRTLRRQYLPLVAGAMLMGSTEIVDTMMAAMLDSGSVAAISYANRVVATIMGVGVLALGTVSLPLFSRLVVKSAWEEVRRTLNRISIIVFAAGVFLMVPVWFFSDEIVSVLFQRGAFSEMDSRIVGQVLAMFILQAPFFLAGILSVRLISALQENRWLLWGTLISVPLNATLNIVFMKIMGVAGIALSTSVVYAISSLYLYCAATRLVRKRELCELHS